MQQQQQQDLGFYHHSASGFSISSLMVCSDVPCVGPSQSGTMMRTKVVKFRIHHSGPLKDFQGLCLKNMT